MIDLNVLAAKAWSNSALHGFHDVLPENRAEKIALMHSELSEALECLRVNPDPFHTWYREDGKPEGYIFELADVIIRVLDEMWAVGVNHPEEFILEKMDFNAKRPHKHGKQF